MEGWRQDTVTSVSQEEPCLLYAKFVLALFLLLGTRDLPLVAQVKGTTRVAV